MHTNSLPPSDRDEILACNEPLRSEAEAFRLSLPLSQADMSRELGISPSALSKWLNKKPEGDIVSLESLVADWLKSRPAREKLKLALFPTAVSRRLASHLEHVRRTNGVAVITGPAGLGKTCAAKIYFAENPTSVLLTAAAYRGNAAAMTRLLWNQVSTRGWKRRDGPRADYLVEKFRESNRLIVVDNCHRLTRGAIEWLFDFHDDTGCSLAFIGNPVFHSTLERLADNDQHLSRTGIFPNLTMTEPKVMAEKMLEAWNPSAKASLLAMASNVVAHRGHCRALRMQLGLTRELISGGISDVADAFRAAHTQLLNRQYPLEAP